MMFGWFAAVFVVFVVAWLVLPAYVRYRRMSSILASGQFATVEGLVTNFSPGDEGGHVPEWFTVNGHSFKYSESDIDPGFHRVRGEGGPLRNGAYVRIAEIDGRIARLEMAR
jgi:hypothetical protein